MENQYRIKKHLWYKTGWGTCYFYGSSSTNPNEEDVGGMIIDNKDAPTSLVPPVVVVTTWGDVKCFSSVDSAEAWIRRSMCVEE